MLRPWCLLLDELGLAFEHVVRMDRMNFCVLTIVWQLLKQAPKAVMCSCICQPSDMYSERERERGFYIFSQPTYSIHRVCSNIHRNLVTK